MHNFRSGDEVSIDIRALVTRVSGDNVRIRFGETEYDATPSELKMLRRSMHASDKVVQDGRSGVIAQSLEEDVFLVRFDGATGADAYRVATREELTHADEERDATSEDRAAATPAPASTTSTQGAEPLELTQPLPEAGEAQAPAPQEPAAGKGPGAIGEMAASLSNMSRTGQRRQPVDLEGIGTTETIPGVREGRGEMTLGDDLRLGGSDA